MFTPTACRESCYEDAAGSPRTQHVRPLRDKLYVCYKHCDAKKPCAGCLNSDAGKPEHCRKCSIKDCVKGKGLTYCFACEEYPCKRLKNLEKSYRTRYHASLTENSREVKELGLTAFMERQKEHYTCPACGGVISLHDGVCTECGAPGK